MTLSQSKRSLIIDEELDFEELGEKLVHLASYTRRRKERAEIYSRTNYLFMVNSFHQFLWAEMIIIDSNIRECKKVFPESKKFFSLSEFKSVT